MEKTDYVAFCERCGHPKRITKTIMAYYYIVLKRKNLYCNHCQKENFLPEHILKIMEDLV